VLHRETIGRQDDFFAMGGHSLLATQLVARLRAAFQVDMPLLAIFEHATVASMATYLDTLEQSAVDPAAISQIQRATRGGQDLTELVDLIENLSDEEITALLAQDVAEE
nr:hypothetical protein [Ktedonobacterales bacterium]